MCESGLPSTTRHVILTLSLYIPELGQGVFPKVKELAAFCGLAEKVVRTHLKLAADRGWISRVERFNPQTHAQISNGYQLALPGDAPLPVKGVAPPTRLRGRGPTRKRVPLTTGNNNGGSTSIEVPTVQRSMFSSPTATAPTEDPWPQTPRRDGNAYTFPEAFELIWQAYPARAGGNPKLGAYRKVRRIVRAQLATASDLVSAAQNLADWCERAGRAGTEFVPRAETFFGSSEQWRDYLGGMPAVPERRGERREVTDPRSFADDELESFEALRHNGGEASRRPSV